MTAALTRRVFLKLLAALPAAHMLGRARLPALDWMAGAKRPNLLVLVYDTLAAGHTTIDGYARDTTPHLARFAEQATVFHRHYSSGNFTTPATASLLTGAYPWSHRAFNIGAPVSRTFAPRNVFAALADPTRRDMVARLAGGDATVGELAAPYPMSVQAVSKHLKVLEGAGLVTKAKDAQRRTVHLEAEVFDLMTRWIERYRREAEARYRRLDAVLAEMDADPDVDTDLDPIQQEEAS